MNSPASDGYGPGCQPEAPARPGSRALGLLLTLGVLSLLVFAGSAKAAPPANDDFADAQILAGLPVTATGSNEGATLEPGEPSLPWIGNDHSVWFSWTAPGSGAVAVDLSGSDYDTYLSVYTGSSLGSLNLIGAESGDHINASRVDFTATAGVTYRLAVDGYIHDTGAIALEVHPTGSISGTLFRDNFAGPLAQTCVDAYDSAGELAGSTETGAGGGYTVEKLATGDYRLLFGRCSFSSVSKEYYQDETTLASADPVAVVSGSDTPDIDAELSQPGAISGMVFDESGSQINGICVTAYDSSGMKAGEDLTEYLGTYLIPDLQTGDYRLEFKDCGPRLFTDEFWNDKAALAEADPIAVTPATTETNISPTLAPDTVPPDTVYISGPEGEIATRETTFRVEGSPVEDTLKIQCRLDDGAFADCPSPWKVTGLSDGPHTVGLRAQDTAGNQDPSPVVRSFSVDATAPDTIINSGPEGTIRTDAATFTFAGTPAADVAKVQCRIDRAAFADCAGQATFAGLGDGVHTAEFRAEDAGGVRDATPASRTFTVDTTVARIARVAVSGPAKAKRGRRAIYRVKITNGGDAPARDVKLVVNGRGIGARSDVGEIAAGRTKMVKVKLRPKKRGKVKAAFRVTSLNAGGGSANKRIKVGK